MAQTSEQELFSSLMSLLSKLQKSSHKVHKPRKGPKVNEDNDLFLDPGTSFSSSSGSFLIIALSSLAFNPVFCTVFLACTALNNLQLVLLFSNSTETFNNVAGGCMGLLSPIAQIRKLRFG
jgi:hypothetical protein